MNRIKLLFILFIFLFLCSGTALADNYGTLNFATLGVADTNRVDNVLQLTRNQYDDEAQCWGAYPWRYDGERIVYQASINGNSGDNNEICTMNSTGDSWQRLTDNNVCDSHPSFTPNGGQIVFQRRVDDNAEIFIMDADGTDQVSLTQAHSGAVLGGCENKPRVSPDGTMIAFYAYDENDILRGIWVMDIDGSNPVSNARGQMLGVKA